MTAGSKKSLRWVGVLAAAGVAAYLGYGYIKKLKAQNAAMKAATPAAPAIKAGDGLTLGQAKVVILEANNNDPLGYISPRLNKLSPNEIIIWANAILAKQSTYVYDGTTYKVNARF